jgi:membrane-bound ClpP family serine protease
MAQEARLRCLTQPRVFAEPSDGGSEPFRAAGATVLELLAVPEIAFSLTAAGLLGLMWWLSSMRLVATGVAGLALLVPGVIGLATLPVSPGGTLLLVLAAASLSMEILAYPGFGLHAVSGWVTLTVAGLFLQGELTGPHPAVVVPVSAFVAAATYRAGRHSRRGAVAFRNRQRC